MAVVGHGYWGKNHVRNFHAMGALAAVCDSDPERLGIIRQKYPNIKTAPDLDTLLSMESIQGVVLATPAVTHEAMALQCL